MVGEELLIDTFPAVKAFLDAMPISNGGFTEAPAQVDFLILIDRWKIDEAGIRVFDEHAGFLNFFKFPFEAGEALIFAGLDGVDAAVVHLRATHHHNVLGKSMEFPASLLVFLAEAQQFAQRLFHAWESELGLQIGEKSWHSGLDAGDLHGQRTAARAIELGKHDVLPRAKEDSGVANLQAKRLPHQHAAHVGICVLAFTI